MGLALPRLNAPGVALELLLLPTGIVGAQTITSWKNESGHTGRDATSSGSPTTVAVDHLRGVSFDGVDDYLAGSIALASDRPLTLLVLSKRIDQSATLRVVFELSDNGSTGRSLQLIHGNTQRALRSAPAGSDGDAGYVYTSTSIVLHTALQRAEFRELRENGKWKSSAGNDAGVARVPTAYRIGASFAGDGFWHGSIVALALISGTVEEYDVEAFGDALMIWARIATPPKPGSNGYLNDLHLTLPATIDAIVDEPVSIWTGGATAVTSGLPVDYSYPDRFTLRASAPGDSALAITTSGGSASATVHAVAALGGASKQRVLCVMDSNGEHFATGAFEYLRGQLGTSKIQFVGSRGPAQGYNTKHECRGSWGWNTFANVDPLQPGTLDPSPFFTGGVLDMAAYFATLDAPPDIILWGLGANDIYGTSLAAVDALIDTILASYAEPIWAACRAYNPAVKQIVTCPWYLASDPAVWANSESSRLSLHAVNRRLVQRYELALAGRESEGLYHRPTFNRCDSWRGYRDGLHMVSAPAGYQHATAFKASIVARYPATTVPALLSATIDGNVSTSKITLVFDVAVHFPDVTGLALAFAVGTARTITGIDSGNDSTSVVLALSGAASGTDSITLRVLGSRTQTAVSGGQRIQMGTTNVTLANMGSLPLTQPGTLVYWAGADSVTFGSGSAVAQFTDKGPAGNHFVQATGSKQGVQSTTAGGNKLVTTDGVDDLYQVTFASSIPANFNGTLYHATKKLRWLGPWETCVNVCKDLIEGSGHYDTGLLLRGGANAYLLTGYGEDPTNQWPVAPSIDTNAHVWAWTFLHGGASKLYKDGALVDTVTCDQNPVALVAARLFALWYPAPNCGQEAFAQGLLYAGADVANAHDAATVAAMSTYLASLMT